MQDDEEQVCVFIQNAPLLSISLQSAFKYQKHKNNKKEGKQAIKEASKKAKKANVSPGMYTPPEQQH